VDGLTDVELRELRIFLALAEELHFRRTAERLGLSQPTVSEAIRVLERRVGARLFERTSRKVILTPAGAELQQKLAPTVQSIDRILGETRDSINGVRGTLRVGTVYTTFLPPVFKLCNAFQARYPHAAVDLGSAYIWDPFTSLRRGHLDVLINWLAADEPDMTTGPVIAYYDRVVAVGLNHRFAARASILAEELADEAVAKPPSTLPASIADAVLPPRTPNGRTIRRVRIGDGSDEAFSVGAVMSAVSRGELVHPTMRGLEAFRIADVVLVPIDDLPPMPLGLLWRTSAEDARIRAMAEVARREGPWPASVDQSLAADRPTLDQPDEVSG
jgi:DNA-binding transcriptional LysR family regulator